MVMDLVWADGFDQWGGQSAAFSQVYNGSPEWSNTARTGAWAAAFYDNVGFSFNLANPISEGCLGAALYPVNGVNSSACWYLAMTYGGVEISLGGGDNNAAWIYINGNVVAKSNPAVLGNNQYQWAELQILQQGTKMIVNVRIQSVLVVSYEDDNFGAGKTITSFQSHKNYGYASQHILDDLVFVSGDEYPGDRRCYYLPVAQDTAKADWAITGAASGADALKNVPPNDAEYISANAAGQQSTFVIGNLPPGEFDSLLGAMLYWRGEKSDAGIGNVQPGFIVGAGQNNGAERQLNVGNTSYMDALGDNPVTGQPYTLQELQGAELTLIRTV